MTVRYPFHPHIGKELEVISPARRPDLPVTVRAPDGYDLKIPSWMLEAAADVEISSVVVVAIEAWMEVIALIEAHERLNDLLTLAEAPRAEDNPSEGDSRAATRAGRDASTTRRDSKRDAGC